MRVLQFIPSLNQYDGGTATYMQQLAPVLGREVDLHVCALTPVSDFYCIAGCTPHSIPLSMLHWRAMKRAWLALLDEIRPDVVHFNCCWMPQIAAVVHWTRAWRNGCQSPYMLLTPHGMLEPWIIERNYWTKKLPAIWLYQRRALREVDCIVATAEEERRHLQQLGWNRNISLVQNGIDVSAITPKCEWHNRHRLLFMSRIHPKKGLELLFRALATLQTEGLSFSLQIAGDGDPDYVAQLKAQAPEGVSFLGAVYGDAKWRLIEESDLVILPSYSENYGLIVAEALASATPVITTQGTPWQSVGRRQAGWWVAAQPEALSNALRAFSRLSDGDVEAMGRRARALAEEECNILQTARLLLQLYC